ncbi:hypothetical protein [Enterococcus avium]|jgi:hypothetical protein|uniref:hypothetical protein n=1 Tax=Enterococcus avium TaxID=33945 RepID=UPI0003A9A29E|nr:hypothetical protein [Enterococcus avium]OJG21376.1 hypothetical protein RU95_GL001386 [Enterococcus avium]
MKVSTSILKYLYKKASLEEFQGSHLFVRLTSFDEIQLTDEYSCATSSLSS